MNLIIAKCVSINPSERPTYDELIDLLNNVANNHTVGDADKQLRVKLLSANREFELSEIREINFNMLSVFYSDFMTALDTLCDRYPDFSMLVHLQTEYKKTYAAQNTHIAYKIKNDVASYIFDTSYYNIYFAVHYHPTYSKKDGSADDKYASISMDYRISSCNSYDELKIEYKNKTLSSVYKNTSCLYEMNVLIDFLENLVDAYISAFDS